MTRQAEEIAHFRWGGGGVRVMKYLTLIQLSAQKNNLNEHSAYTDSGFSVRNPYKHNARAFIYQLYSMSSQSSRF